MTELIKVARLTHTAVDESEPSILAVETKLELYSVKGSEVSWLTMNTFPTP